MPTTAGALEQGVATPCSTAMRNIYHITWVTHNSRVSPRMIKYKVKRGEPIWFDADSEVIITKIIAEIVKEKQYKVHIYNICKDHIHILLECQHSDLSNILRHLKGKSAQRYKEFLNLPAEIQFRLWAQKFNWWLIESNEQYYNTKAYIIRNREKHGYSENKGLQPLVLSMMKIVEVAANG